MYLCKFEVVNDGKKTIHDRVDRKILLDIWTCERETLE